MTKFTAQLNSALETLVEAPPDQIAPEIVEKLRVKIAAGITSADMKEILDECAHDSLASDFAMIAMHTIWGVIIKEEEASR